MKLIHDDAPIRTAGIIESWLDGNGIPPVDWPPYSADLNPTENAWDELKDHIYKLYLDLESFDDTKNQLKSGFIRRLRRHDRV